MKLIKIICLGILMFSTYVLTSCSKNFLDKKPSSKLVVPAKLEDFRNLLDAYFILNRAGSLCEVSSDDYFLLDNATWESMPVYVRNAYIWKPDIYEGTSNIADWNLPYKQVLYANTALEGLNKIEEKTTNQKELNELKGWAFFLRAFAFFNLSQTFASPYDETTANTDLGVPLRMEADITAPSQRASLQETYNQILSDLTQAKELLPAEIQVSLRNRPCKPAALALLARVYLSMRKYEKALTSAEESLQLYSTLMDYNSTTRFTRRNDETMYQAEMETDYILLTIFPNTIIDSALYSSYSEYDLRKSMYFKISAEGNPVRRANYTGVITPFIGLATDEVYLIKAECQARSGDQINAMNTLNELLVKRWISNTFTPLTANSASEALDIILSERRKELVFRGLRWQDLRRLNKEGKNITLQRALNGQIYTLPANSPLYALPIPPDEIRLSGIQQNSRS